jgi:hypothetical protein
VDREVLLGRRGSSGVNVSKGEQVLGRPKGVQVQTAPPPLSPLDQKVIKSFQSLPVENRKSTLDRLLAAAKSGDKEANRKLGYLVPIANNNVPMSPDYTDKSLSGRLYQGSQFLQSQIPSFLGTGTAGEMVSRNQTGQVTNVNAGKAETPADTALRGVEARLNLANPSVALGTKAPLAVAKAMAKAGGISALSGALGELDSHARAGKNAAQIAKDAAKSAASNFAIGAVVGGAGRAAEEVLKGHVNVSGTSHGLVEASKLKNVEGVKPDPGLVLAYKTAIQDGKPIEPIKVVKDSKGQLQVEDGKHRLEAMKQLGIKEIPVVGKTDATIQALKATPSRGAEAASEAKSTLQSQAGALGPKPKEAATPAIAELRSKVVSGVPKGQRINIAKNKAQEFAQKVDTQLHDRYAPVKALVSAYEKAIGRPLTADENTYILARLHSGSVDLARQRIQDFGDLLREAPDLQAVKDIGVAQRILTDRSGIKNPISQDTARQVVTDYKQKLGPEAFAKTQATINKVIQYHDAILKDLADNGMVSKQAYDAIKAKNQNYFAKFDVVDHLLENAGNLRKGASFNVAKQDLIRSQKGTTAQIADPVEASIRQIARATDLIERNKVGRSLYEMSKNTPELVKQLGGDSVPSGYEKISTFVGGKKIDLAVPKDVGEALKHLTAQQADLVTKTASLTGNILRKTATSLNAGFAFVSNPIRDVQSFALNSKYVRKNPVSLARAWLGGFTEALKQGDVYREFIAAKGGQSTFFNPKDAQKTAQQITRTPGESIGHTIVNPKNLLGIIPTIERVGQTIELAPRLAEFKAARAAGKGATQAAFDARNVTVDFSQSGTVGQVLNQWVPFLNARLQGNLKGLEAIKRSPVGSTVVITSYIGLPTLATYMWNRQHYSDVYDQIPQYVKDTNFIIIYGNGKDAAGNFNQVVKIPKGDFAKVFGNSFEEFLNFAYHKDPKSIAQVATEAFSNLSPVSFTRDGRLDAPTAIGNALPPLVKGAVENAANYSFFKGGPLVPDRLKQLPNKEQVAPNTSKIAIALGNATGQSPIKVDNLLSSFTANTARTVQSPQDFGKSITGRVSGAPATNAQNKFYDVLNRTTPLRNSASEQINAALEAGDRDKARQIADNYNRQLEAEFAGTKSKYGQYWDQNLKDLYDAQTLKLTPRSIHQREAHLKKK